MYRIGEFSKMTNLSIKTLRYYDQEGLLCPSERGENGYRLYGEEDVKRAELIVLLRGFDFTIGEMRDVLHNCQDEQDLQFSLREKRSRILESIHRERALARAIERRLTKLEQEEQSPMSYQIEEKTIPAQLAACIRYRGSYSDCSRRLGAIYKEVGNKACGAPIHLCYDDSYVEEGDLEICVPVSGHVSCKSAVVRQLPAVRVLATTHVGPYDGFGAAYKALLDYAQAHSLTLGLPHRLVYRKGPGLVLKGNPEKYVSEVLIPIV